MNDENKQPSLETTREHEPIEGYSNWAEDFQTNPDPLAEIDLNDNLVPSTEDDW
jgi:hypothetical protein